MISFEHVLLIFCVVLITSTTKTTSTTSIDDFSEKEIQVAQRQPQSGRSIASSYEADEANEEHEKREQHEAFRKRAKPLKNIFMGIYKNYKSTYLGNKTSLEYKKTLRDRMSANTSTWSSSAGTEVEPHERDAMNVASDIGEGNVDNSSETDITETTPLQTDELDALEEQLTDAMSLTLKAKEPPDTTFKTSKKIRKRKRKFHSNNNNNNNNNSNKQGKLKKSENFEESSDDDADDALAHVYSVGPGVNMSLDMSNDIINVNLNADNLREIMAGRWLSDNSEQGRSKKYDMMTKVLPLFILPFLIQSAIVPFLVTKLKLLLIKSILVGKLAIFLLIISAIKNSNKMMQTYEVAPSYWAGEPSRRSEIAAMASSAPYNGYRVEGKPTTWIN